MDLSKVKLVVSDMDGTLLNSKGEVSKLFFELFHQLKNKDILFCAASGRQYNSIIDKLAPIKDDIFVIAENGGIAKKGDQLLTLNALSEVKINNIIPIIRTIPNAHIVLCGKNKAFIESKNQHFIRLFQEYYHSYQLVTDLTKITSSGEFLKIAIYHSLSSEKHIYPFVKEFENEVLIKTSSKNWLDISDQQATKGNALIKIQKLLNISREETLVFGDYHNDIEMLKEADFSFSMKNAHKDITRIANYTTESNDHFGVERVLTALVKNNTI